MKKIAALLFALAMCFALATGALADTGPKPSVHIRLENAPEGVFYGTLLSRSRSSGPYIYDPDHTPEDSRRVQYLDVWREFQRYEDPDGYYFLNELWDCSGGELAWTYYPPADFKLLLYFPDTGEWRVSAACSRYAFDSYYTVDLARPGELVLEQSYDYGGELLGILARAALTIALEVLAAIAFGYRTRRTLGFIALVNLATQLALNIILNVWAYFSGSSLFVFIVLEILVTFVEAVIYRRELPRRSAEDAGTAVAYAIIANLLSLIAGEVLSNAAPGIF